MNEQELRSEITCERCGHPLAQDARFCSRCGAPLESAAPREERRLVSILFVDLEGFTASSDDADPEDVRDAQSRAALAAALRTTGDDETAAVTTSEARQILTDFAATLAPSRAETLLASPPARETLDARG